MSHFCVCLESVTEKVNVIKKKKEVRCMFVCTGMSLLTYCESTFLLTDAQ